MKNDNFLIDLPKPLRFTQMRTNRPVPDSGRSKPLRQPFRASHASARPRDGLSCATRGSHRPGRPGKPLKC